MKNIINRLLTLILIVGIFISPKASIRSFGGSKEQNEFFNLNQQKVYIDVESQVLYLTTGYNSIIATYKISTGRNGTGEQPGSYKTPRGLFLIQSKIGEHQDPMSKYKARVKVGQYDPAYSRYDNILSRILTLDGVQDHNKNTRQRCVYIHGTSAVDRLGKKPCSMGCVRMCPYEIVDFFNRIDKGTTVYIHDKNNKLPWESKATVHINQDPSLLSDIRASFNVQYT